MICDVEINKNDSCVTYALKRIGKFDLYPIDYGDLINQTVFDVLPFDKEILLKGDILLFDAKVEKEYYPHIIDSSLRIVDKKIWTGFHLSVYEGEGFVSDCNKNRNYFYPIISLSKIDDMNANKILRIKK